MKQNKITTINGAINSAQLILTGIAEVGIGITLTYNPQADLNTDLVNAIMARGNHEQAKLVKATRRNALVDEINRTQKFVRATRDLFKMLWGNDYSQLFTALGFQGDLSVSDSIEDLVGMLIAIKTHLTNNPTQELGTLVTAAHAQSLLDALNVAQGALASQEGEIETLMAVRDGKFEILRKRLSDVYQELRMQLDPLDGRWLKLGLNMPGADETPDKVEGVQVTLIGATAAAVKWDAAVRAAYYRVWYRLHGATGDYIAAGSPADLDFTIENLPAASAIDIVVTAVNTGGESPLSEVMTIATH
jgi:hypothetical protein